MWVGRCPSAASSTMCIRNLRLGFLSRFIPTIRSLRSSGVRVILCIWAAVFSVAGWIWRLYHATEDGRLFNHPVHLSRYWLFTAVVGLSLVVWVHFIPTGDYEAPIEDIYAVYGSPLVGLFALVVLVGLVVSLAMLAIAAIQTLRFTNRS